LKKVVHNAPWTPDKAQAFRSGGFSQENSLHPSNENMKRYGFDLYVFHAIRAFVMIICVGIKVCFIAITRGIVNFNFFLWSAEKPI
jgi:hypothetical protein